MNLDELQSVQSRERQASSLQHLRASFYEEAGEYIGELQEERNELAAAADDPFDSPEVERLSDDIRTAERTVESIYERRVGKVVKLASIAAADMPYDDEGLTREEEQLFEMLVDAIERNRERVLSVLDGEAPSLDCTPSDRGSDEARLPSAGSPPVSRESTAVGDGTDEAGPAGDRAAGPTPDRDPATPDGDRPAPPARPPAGETDPTTATDATASPADPVGTGREETSRTADATDRGATAADESLDIGGAMGGDGADTDTGRPGRDGTAVGGAEDTAGGPPGSDPEDPVTVQRTTVRITADVGDIFGVDGRSYDLSSEDVVTLPTPNADSLVSKDAAERLD